MSKKLILNPCPFCQGPPVPIVVRGSHLGGGVFDLNQIPPDGIDAEAYVFCHECGALGPAFDETVYSEDGIKILELKAVQGWQCRDDHNRNLYDAGDKEGLNNYPRENEK